MTIKWHCKWMFATRRCASVLPDPNMVTSKFIDEISKRSMDMSSNIEVSRVRRRALMLGGSIAAGFATNLFPQVASATGDAPEAPTVHPGEKLPVKEIEEILRADGKVTNGILVISLDRKDLHVTGPGGIPFKAAWQVNHEFAFQSLGDDKAIVTGELSLLSKETNPVIDQII